MNNSLGYKCFKCHRELTAEERLLAAIFGEIDEPLCYDCQGLKSQPQCQCHICGEPTNLSFNGQPTCLTHIEVPNE